MKLTHASLRNPATIAVVTAVIALLGVITLFRLPVQLFPNIEQPQIAVIANWPTAAPAEMESEIVKPIEEVMQGIPGMEELRTFASQGQAFLNMSFALETDMDNAVLEVISRLNRLPPLPADSDPPTVLFGGFDGANESLIWFFAQTLVEGDRLTPAQERVLLDYVRPRLEAVEGVAGVNIQRYTGGADQLQIIFDPYRAAELGIDLTAIPARIGATSDTSGGVIDVGKRQYTLRFASGYTPERLSSIILDWRGGRPIRLGDVATVEVGEGRQIGFGYQNGRPAIGVQVLKASGANVLDALDKVKSAVAELNRGVLADAGLQMEKSFDPSVFILRAINLLTGNLAAGVILTLGVLWWFLRQIRATLLIAITIPISLLATFIVLGLAGRSFNVISLAGLAFATGMVVDAAIVVLENIVRLREKRVNAAEAAEKGTLEVWGALLASTATTVAIFIPVLFLKDVEGQLFADLALTIAIAVTVSLFVAITILPAAASKWLTRLPPDHNQHRIWQAVADRITRLTAHPMRRLGIIGGLILVPVLATVLLMPRLNYLPPVKRDAVDGFFLFPSGINAKTMDEEVAKVIVARLDPYLKGEKEPALLNYYLLTWNQGVGGIGIRAKDQKKVHDLERVVNEEILSGFPDIVAFAQEGNLFGGFGGSESVEINIQTSDMEAARLASIAGMNLIQQEIPGANINPGPDPNVVSPELRIHPNDERLNEVGWTRNQAARVVQALGAGLWLGEHFDGERRLDIILKADAWESPESLAAIPVATPSGAVVPLGNLVEIERTVGPVAIQRYDGRRTFTLNVNPPQGMALEDVMAVLTTKVEPQLRAMLPADGTIVYGGSADALKRAVTSLGTNFLIALGLLFMIMAALFRSMKDALFVMIAIPLATVGGIVLIRLLNLVTFQPLDLLTMIGFIILLGLVVNNAILLVVKTREGEAEGLTVKEAVRQALELRLRPILMSTLTSLFGMLPLLAFPGVGSAIYRGMAAAIVGGMSVSTIFTLILLPSLLQVEARDLRAVADRLRGKAVPAGSQAAE